MRKVVGLDISLQKTAVCVLDHDGQIVWQGKVDSEPGPLIEKLRLWHDQIDVVGLEACPLFFRMAAPAPRRCRLQGYLRRDAPRTAFSLDPAGQDGQKRRTRHRRDDARRPLPAGAREVS